jgi:hypothetical protein
VSRRHLEAALGYARRGWRVFPIWGTRGERCACGREDCRHPGKHPLGKLVPHGVKDATTDPRIITGWWRRYPKANIGIATGPDGGLLLVDIDPRNGGHLDRLPGNLPVTPMTLTGGGGVHFYLQWPDGLDHLPKTLLGCPGVDLKGAGGYVLTPPSTHISGERYAWKIPPGSTPVAPCPDWLLELIKRHESRPAGPVVPLMHQGADSAYGRAALRNELVRLAQTPEGGRNNALNRAAYSLGRLVAGGHLDGANVAALLATVALNAGLGEREVERTLRSGLRAGMEVARV